MRVHIGTVIRLGDFAVGSSGDFGPCPTVGIDLKTGNVLWQDRQFARSTFLYADHKLIIMDENGNLGLATAARDGLKVLARASVLSNRAWTVPTLVRHDALRQGSQTDRCARPGWLTALWGPISVIGRGVLRYHTSRPEGRCDQPHRSCLRHQHQRRDGDVSRELAAMARPSP